MATLQQALYRCLETIAAALVKRTELMAPVFHSDVGIAAAGDDRRFGMIAGVAPCVKSFFDRRKTRTIAKLGYITANLAARNHCYYPEGALV